MINTLSGLEKRHVEGTECTGATQGQHIETRHDKDEDRGAEQGGAVPAEQGEDRETET